MIAYNDRTLVLGPTGRGKSVLLNVQFSALRCQRALYDSKDEWSVRGVEPARDDVDAIDWRQPIVHYIPGEDGRGDAQRFFTRAFERRHLVVAVHELADLCEYRAHATPPAVSRYLRQGRAHGLGLLAASQRPFEMPRSARTEAEHVFAFAGLDPDDVDVVRQITNGQVDAGVLEQLQQELGYHAFVYYDKGAGTLTRCPPLPAHLRNRSVITKRSVA